MRLLPLFLMVALAGCDTQAPDANASRRSGPLPAAICDQSRASLEKLRAGAALDFKDDGEAVIEQDLWLQMTPDAREQLAQTLAFHASCAARRGSPEQAVAIRSQFGTVLMRRTIDTTLDLESLLGG